MSLDENLPGTHSEETAAALRVMQIHLDGLNAHDEDLLAASLHFPHYRLVNGVLKTWESRENYFADFRKRAGEEWGYSRWGEIEVLMESPDKVHLNVRVDRYRKDDAPLASFHSLWVITKINGVWAAQLRSSFAPG